MPRCHDYRFLVRRWRALARAVGQPLQLLSAASEFPVYVLRTAVAPHPGTIYLSAGIHGDEPAGPAALIEWAEKNMEPLRSRPFFLLSCLNPWGLLHNCRDDEAGRDLNRTFADKRPPAVVRELLRLIEGERFALSLTLHEDYDANGFYVYEVMRQPPFWGEKLLRKVRPLIAIDSRARIDRRRAFAGLVRRQFKPQRFPAMPESIYLHRRHSYRTFTTETPSEFALEQRIAAHVAAIEECVRLSQMNPREGNSWPRARTPSKLPLSPL
ncbi:MAG: M14 family metallopeptidase [Chthoniobacterales bacterium]